jgi:hypothetical protein
MRHKLIGYIFKMAAEHPKLASDSLEKNPDNIAVSFLPDFKSLSKLRKHMEPCVWMQDVGDQ